MRNQGPSLTPSLANYFRADLIAHVMNWPAEILEKQVCVPVMTHTFNGSLTFAERFIHSINVRCIFPQAQISSDEAIIIGDLQCTKVSADLKSARSVVRITEITATLQEQK